MKNTQEIFTGFTKKPFLIAGNCALETESLAREVAACLKSIAEELDITVIFKGSYSKANRTRQDSFHGTGIEKGLDLLRLVKSEYGLPVTSDVHEIGEIDQAAEALDIIQIPALLCKNTSILHAAGDTGSIVNIKKGHFITAYDMRYSVEKVASRGNKRIMITERGNLFGYADTIVDFRSIDILKSIGCPIVFDASHSVRNTSRRSEDPEGGTPEAINLLTRCAAAAGAHGLFAETHPSPQDALCDSVVAYPLNNLKRLMQEFMALRKTVDDINKRANRPIQVKLKRTAG